MGYRFAQLTLLILGLAFAFTALDALTEPWRTMNEAVVAETICGHAVGLVLSIICFRTALYFGIKAAYGAGKQIREPEL